MAALVLGGVGAAIGSVFGGPAGASIGWAIGSTVGNILQPQKVSGPRLSDLTTTDSAYGNMIPIAYGAMRMAGNVIWSSGLIESESGGGKGGPSVTTYSYSQSFAIALCEGPIEGIRRIWANGELIFDQGNLATGSQIQANDSLTDSIIIYKGDESQMPDPTIVADQTLGGATITPAYRGVAYLVFNRLQLDKFGNRMPNIECEVVVSGTYVGAGNLATTLIPVGFVSGNDVVANNPNHVPIVGAGYINSYKNGILRVGTISGNTTYLFNDVGENLGQEAVHPTELPFPSPNAAGYVPFAKVSGGALCVYFDNNGRGTKLGSQTAPKLKAIAAGDPLGGGGGDLATALPSGEYLMGAYRCSDNESILCSIASDPGKPPYKWAIIKVPTGATNASIVATGTMVRDNGGTLITNTDGDGYPIGSNIGCLESDYSRLWFQSSSNNDGVALPLQIVSGKMSTASQYYDAINNTYLPLPIGTLDYWPFNDNFFYADAGVCVIINSDYLNIITVAENLTGSGVSAAAIIQDIAARVGLDASQLDVSQVSGDANTCLGMVLGAQMAARSAIETVAQVFTFDAVESDGKLRLVKRGGASVALIPEADMAAQEGAQTGEIPDALSMTRTQEVDLPQIITIKYPDVGQDYRVGTQYARYPLTDSQQQTTYEIPVAMTHDTAAQIAEILLYAAWKGRTEFTFETSRKWAFLEPCDVIQVQKKAPDGSTLTQTVRITQKSDGGNGVIQFSVVHDEENIYQSNATGVALPNTAQTISVQGPTKLMMLDIPCLRDQDSNAGVYIAASGYLPAWKGAGLYQSINNIDFTPMSNHLETVPTPMGTALTALPNFTGGNAFDEASTLKVQLIGGAELYSTDALSVFNNGNAALVGDELIQYREASLVSPGVYMLTGLLRGRKGTEAAMGAHVAGERFCTLSPATLDRLIEGQADIGATKYYKAPSQGMTLADATTTAITDTGRSLTPLAPVYGQGWQLAADWNLSWMRRTRVGGDWMDNVDASVGEASELYSIDFYSDASFSTIVRTMASSTPSAVWTQAMQTSDMGASQSSVHAIVYQVSAVVGRGAGVAIAAVGTKFYGDLLFPFDGPNGSKIFTDMGKNHVVPVQVGNPVISTAVSRFGGASLYLDGASHLEVHDDAVAQVPIGDFTIDFWFATTGTNAYSAFMTRPNGAFFAGAWLIALNNGANNGIPVIYWADYSVNSPFMLSSAGSFNDGALHHFAWVKSGNTHFMFVDGVMVASAITANNFQAVPGSPLVIGNDNSFSGRAYTGYMDEPHIVYGQALWTSNFTPPTSPY